MKATILWPIRYWMRVIARGLRAIYTNIKRIRCRCQWKSKAVTPIEMTPVIYNIPSSNTSEGNGHFKSNENTKSDCDDGDDAGIKSEKNKANEENHQEGSKTNTEILLASVKPEETKDSLEERTKEVKISFDERESKTLHKESETSSMNADKKGCNCSFGEEGQKLHSTHKEIDHAAAVHNDPDMPSNFIVLGSQRRSTIAFSRMISDWKRQHEANHHDSNNENEHTNEHSKDDENWEAVGGYLSFIGSALFIIGNLVSFITLIVPLLEALVENSKREVFYYDGA
jgi:hypothetical protein